MVTKLEAVRLPKAAEIVARTLRRKIVTHELQADDPLPPEDQLMAEMAVARTTVREALRILTPPARSAAPPATPSTRTGRSSPRSASTPSWGCCAYPDWSAATARRRGGRRRDRQRGVPRHRQADPDRADRHP